MKVETEVAATHDSRSPGARSRPTPDFASGVLAPVIAAPGDTDIHSTVADLHVTSAIAMTGHVPNFS